MPLPNDRRSGCVLAATVGVCPRDGGTVWDWPPHQIRPRHTAQPSRRTGTQPRAPTTRCAGSVKEAGFGVQQPDGGPVCAGSNGGRQTARWRAGMGARALRQNGGAVVTDDGGRPTRRWRARSRVPLREATVVRIDNSGGRPTSGWRAGMGARTLRRTFGPTTPRATLPPSPRAGA